MFLVELFLLFILNVVRETTTTIHFKWGYYIPLIYLLSDFTEYKGFEKGTVQMHGRKK
jgi:hypothetical protein